MNEPKRIHQDLILIIDSPAKHMFQGRLDTEGTVRRSFLGTLL